jgi:putative ABC transport system permease protein
MCSHALATAGRHPDEVQARDAVTFSGATVGLGLLLLFASLIPAWRATRVDPIVALRTD